MKRKIAREKNISAFKIDIDELDGLINTLKKEFDNGAEVRVSIELNFDDDETYELKSVDELRHSDIDHKSCNKFSIDLYGDEQSFSLNTDFIAFVAEIRVRGSRKAWCAEIIEVAEAYLKNHRAWHYMISGQGMLIFLLLTTISTLVYYNKFTDMPPIGLFGSFIVVVLVIPIWIPIRDKIFPVGVIILKGKNKFEERMLIWTVITAVVGLLGLLTGLITWVSDKL